jgi:hypothetical protein
MLKLPEQAANQPPVIQRYAYIQSQTKKNNSPKRSRDKSERGSFNSSSKYRCHQSRISFCLVLPLKVLALLGISKDFVKKYRIRAMRQF